MADVQWIKIKVGMFDGDSFKKIKRAKIGGEKFRDKLTAVWFELMDFAGRCNHGGAFIDKREIPYRTLDDIATMIDREPDELELCMQFFINEGMVEIINDVFMLSNWLEYQNEAGLEKIREQKRIAQAKWRAKKAIVESHVDSTEHLPSISHSYSKDSCNEEGDYKGGKKATRHKYGEYNNVLLTDEDFDKLKAEFPDWVARIERLSSYMASTGKSYKNHLATIRNWARKDSESPKQERGGNVFLEMLNEERGV